MARLDAGTIETIDRRRAKVIAQLERKQVTLLTSGAERCRQAATEPKAKKAAPAPKVIEAAPVEIEEQEAPAEPRYIMVEPDDTPPIVHVDPPAPGDVVAEHRRDELAAAREKIDELESQVSGFITIVREKEQEIVELQVRVENLMTRQRQQILFVGDILDRCAARRVTMGTTNLT